MWFAYTIQRYPLQISFYNEVLTSFYVNCKSDRYSSFYLYLFTSSNINLHLISQHHSTNTALSNYIQCKFMLPNNTKMSFLVSLAPLFKAQIVHKIDCRVCFLHLSARCNVFLTQDLIEMKDDFVRVSRSKLYTDQANKGPD